jgi:hypothetical protein
VQRCTTRSEVQMPAVQGAACPALPAPRISACQAFHLHFWDASSTTFTSATNNTNGH